VHILSKRQKQQGFASGQNALTLTPILDIATNVSAVTGRGMFSRQRKKEGPFFRSATWTYLCAVPGGHTSPWRCAPRARLFPPLLQPKPAADTFVAIARIESAFTLPFV
jgi:hypothetical protein